MVSGVRLFVALRRGSDDAAQFRDARDWSYVPVSTAESHYILIVPTPYTGRNLWAINNRPNYIKLLHVLFFLPSVGVQRAKDEAMAWSSRHGE